MMLSALLCQAVLVASVSLDRADEHLLATSLIQTNVVGPRASSWTLMASSKPNASSGEHNSSEKGSAASENDSVPESGASHKAQEASNSTVPSADEAANASKQAMNSSATPIANASASATNETVEETAPVVRVAREDSSSEEVTKEQAEAAAAAAAEAASTVLGWTPDDNVTATVNYASSYDLQNSRGSVLLWTMAATYGALTVLALLLFIICADRQKHAAQLQVEKATRAPAPRPML